MAEDYEVTLDCGCKLTICWVQTRCTAHDAPASLADDRCALHVVGGERQPVRCGGPTPVASSAERDTPMGIADKRVRRSLRR